MLSEDSLMLAEDVLKKTVLSIPANFRMRQNAMG